MNGKRQESFLGTRGFYIALGLCAALLVILVAVFLLGGQDSPTVTTSQLPSSQTVESEEPVLSTVPQQITELPQDTVSEEPPDTSSNITPTMQPEEVPETSEPVESVEPVTSTDVAEIVVPLRGETIATFSLEELQYNETVGDWRLHDAMDIEAVSGTPVVAACSGTVIALESGGPLGNTIVLSHSDGYETVYASLEDHFLVEVGDTVRAGQEIGTVGNSSVTESALGAHLHFAVKQDGKAIDPNSFLAQ